MAVIKTENLTYVYGEGTPFRKTAVDNVNIEINDGEMVGIIGHTGSGKSTLIQHFNGLLKPTSGSVYIDGERLWDDKSRLRPIRFKVGLVFQYPEYQLFEETCYKDIAFGPKNMGIKEDQIDKYVKEAARMVGLSPEILDKSPFELSGGQKRRVAIAGVLAMMPQVLILDEPTAGLDPKGRDEILNLLKSLNEKEGLTIVIVSHSMEDMGKFANRLLVMSKGKLIFDDTPRKVFRQYKKLEEIGLAAPKSVYIFDELKQKGLSCDGVAITPREVVEGIIC